MQTAVDDFEQELEPLVQAQMLADWDAAIDASDEHEQQLVDASKRVDAVLAGAGALRAARRGRSRAAPATPTLARRVRLARLASESGQRERALADRIIEAEARLGSLFSRHRGQLRGREVNDNEIAKVLRESTDRAERRRGLGGLQVDRPAGRAARARARAPAQRGRARARLSRPLRVLADARRARRELAAEPARRPRRAARGDLGAHQGGHRRRSARAPRPGARRDAAAVGLRRRVLPGRAGRERRPARGGARAPRPGRGRARLLPRARRRRRRACSRAATSIRATARTSTRSAPTSTGATTCACSRTASRARAGSATMVHELGHAVYDLAIDPELPWLLRQPAHTFTTEAIAMLHGRLVRDETFLERFAARRARDRPRSAQRRDAAPRAARLRRPGCRS